MPAHPGSGCPLCGRAESDLLESIAFQDLIALYARSLAVAVDAEFAAYAESGIEIHECSNCGLEYSLPAISGSAAFYERILELDSYYQEDKSEFEFARSFVGSSDRVLEVGAGAGAFAVSLRCAEYVGLEFNSVSIAKAASAGVSLLREDLHEHATNHKAHYSLACAFQVLEHVTEPGRFVQSLRQALVPGGRLILSVPSAESFLSFQTNNPLNLPPHHLTWWPDRTFKALATAHDLTLESVRHHPLDAVHRDGFVHTSLVNLLGLHERKVDLSLSFRVWQRIASALVPLARQGFKRAASSATGESVTAVFFRP